MPHTHHYPRYSYRRSPDQDAAEPVHHPVIVVGAGPVGLCAAIDLARQGVAVVLLDEDHTVSVGSRAICFAKRTLEIFDRLGCGQALVDKGITWNLGRVYFRNQEIYKFKVLAEPDHQRPAFINLQQYYVEELLVARAAELGVDLRWQNRVVAVEPQAGQVRLRVATPEGDYALTAAYLIAADGAKSTVRRQLGLESRGQVFQDRFLIADVVMNADFLTQRWFWFDPPFHPGQSVLLHRQADNVWRIDFQLGWDADPEQEQQPERVTARIRAMFGEDFPFTLEWVSVYTFACRRLEKFRHGRVLFVGDAAHQVSPFGARGANSGIQDADNLVWKLAQVLAGHAPERLLDSYDAERLQAADDNIRHSTRATEFITPKSAISRTFRDAVLTLAARQPFARTLVNSGRLSLPTALVTSALNTPDSAPFAGDMAPGVVAADAPIVCEGQPSWLLAHLGDGFAGLLFCTTEPNAEQLEALTILTDSPLPVLPLVVSPEPLDLPAPLINLIDSQGRSAERYDARPGSYYLIRPDQYIAGRWRELDVQAVQTALARVLAKPLPEHCHP